MVVPILIYVYQAIDAAGNIEFVASRYDSVDAVVGNPIFLGLVFVAGMVWLLRVGNEPPKAMVPAFINIKKMQRAILEPWTYSGVVWPVSIRNGALSIETPRCSVHNKALEYKPSFVLTPIIPPEPSAPLPGLTPLAAPDPVAALTRFGPPVYEPPPPTAEEVEREKLGLGDLGQGHSSGDNHGPYCFECKSLKPIPGTVQQCQHAVRLEIEEELRKDAEKFCD